MRQFLSGLTFFLLPLLAPARDEGTRLFLLQDACVRCHLLLPPRVSPDPVLGWSRSVHFRPEATCVDCHGGDKYFYIPFQRGHIGLPSPEDIPELCGRCHPRAAADEAARTASDERKCRASCVNCHGYHDTPAAGSDFFTEEKCGRCHPLSRAARAREAVEKARAALEFAAAEVEARERQGFPVESWQRELRGIKDQFSRSFHREPVERLPAAMTATLAALDGFNTRLADSSPRRWRGQGYIVVIFLTVFFLLLTGYGQTLRSKEKKE